MKSYLQLTIQGKARRLRKMVLKALPEYNLDVKKVSLITNEQNGIFRIDTHDKQKYIMRVSIPDSGHDLAHINSEMILLNALNESSDINAPIPLQNKSGKWVTTVQVDGVPQARHCTMFSWVDGVDLADRRSPETWEKFGALSAKLHQVATRFAAPKDFSIYTYDSPFPFREDCQLFTDDNRQFFTDEQFEIIQQALDRIQADIDDLFQNRDEIIVTHGDLHQWNVRIARGKLSPIDFEDIMWAHPIQDIATTLYYNRYAENYDDLYAAFKSGYSSITPFPEKYEGQVETHMLSRRLGLLNYVFTAEEEDITEFPNFIPLTMERITWIKSNVWDKL